MKSKDENVLINWESGDMEAKKAYFKCLRMFIDELDSLCDDDVNEMIEAYNVSFVNIDDIERVNIDFPE